MAGFADINHWQLTGRMARDAEVQESKPEATAHFYAVVAFDRDEASAEAFKKGGRVRLSGRVSAWRDQAGKERLGLVADELTAIE